MDPKLMQYLKEHGVKYIVHEHPAVFTVEEAEKVITSMPGVMHTKNLFLKDGSGKFFLVCMNALRRLDLKALKDILHAKKKLFFASSEELKEKLHLTPGSVSILGMIYAQDVTLIIDKEVWESERVGSHPNINTATLELKHEDLEKFYHSLTTEKFILELPLVL